MDDPKPDLSSKEALEIYRSLKERGFHLQETVTQEIWVNRFGDRVVVKIKDEQIISTDKG